MSNAIRTVEKFFPNIKSVKDATAALKIEVTKRDDHESRKGDHKECALAHACKRLFKVDGVIISRSVAYLVKNNKATRFDVPPLVAREITSFDRGAGFSPGMYQLSKPTRCRLNSNHAAGPHKKKGNKPTPFRHITNHIRAVLAGKDAQA